MTRRAARRGATTGLLLATALSATTREARAQSYTLGDIVARVRAADSIAEFATVKPNIHARLERLATFFVAHRVMSLDGVRLATIYAGTGRSFGTVLRLDRDALGDNPPGLADSLTALRLVAFNPLRDSAERRIGARALDSLYAPIDEWTRLGLLEARDHNVALLREYAVKYGPDSPRLNVVEALLNYALQLPQGSPFSGSDRGPSPLEMVAAFRPVNFAAAGDSAGAATSVHPTTAAQLGLRVYNFSPGCGEGNVVQRLMSSCRYGLGWFLLGPRDVSPLSLWKGRTSHGVYASVANYHLGYVFGQEHRLSVGVDTQVLPFLY